MVSEVRGPRERHRALTRGEIKEAAVRQLADGGVESVVLLRIAKGMGMSGPALYRYFASRDELLAELVLDAYRSMAEAVQAVDTTDGGSAALHALARSHRAWAMAHPQLYLLIQGTRVPGFTAPAETVLRARAVLGPFLPVFATGQPSAALTGLVREFRQWLADNAEVAGWVEEWTGYGPRHRAAAVALTGAIVAWPQMHGAVSLETLGQFDNMGHQPATLLDAQIGVLAEAFRLGPNR